MKSKENENYFGYNRARLAAKCVNRFLSSVYANDVNTKYGDCRFLTL